MRGVDAFQLLKFLNFVSFFSVMNPREAAHTLVVRIYYSFYKSDETIKMMEHDE